MRREHRRIGRLALWWIGILILGCNRITGIDGYSVGSADASADAEAGDAGCTAGLVDCDDDPTNGCETDLRTSEKHCGACGKPCGPRELCESSACVPGCAGRVVYVSTSGSDANDGCQRDKPKRTIGGAIALVRTIGAVAHSIHVCRGIYAETALTLDYPVSIFGGYECSTWERVPEYGFPKFDRTNESVIVDGASPATGVTLKIAGTTITDAVVVDGVTLRPAAAATTIIDLLVSDGAKPRIENIVTGGGAPAKSGTSVGVYVTSAAAPEIAHSNIDGGAGVVGDGTHGSIGINLTAAGAARIHDNFINGGSGTAGAGGVGSTGVYVASALVGPSSFSSNVVNGGSGKMIADGSSTLGHASIGVQLVDGSSAEITQSSITGGDGTCKAKSTSAPSCAKLGVFATGPSSLKIGRSRLYAGSDCGPQVAACFLRGVALISSDGAVLTNDFIHGGSKTSTPPTFVSAVFTGTSNGVLVAHNTLHVGASTDGYVLYMGSGTRNATVQNNVMIGARANDNAIAITSCGGASSIAALQSNVFANVQKGTLQATYTGTPCTTESHPAISDAIATLRTKWSLSSAASDGNIAIAGIADCVGDAACIGFEPCSSARPSHDCFLGLFEKWTAADDGVTELLGPGWLQSNPPPCRVSRGGLDLTKSIATDLFGSPRTVPVSIGAHERDDTCDPP